MCAPFVNIREESTMKNIPELIYKSHQTAKSIWDKNQSSAMGDLCHSLLEQQLQYMSPLDLRLQKMLIDNCEILSFQGDFEAIFSLLRLIDIFQEREKHSDNNLNHMYNRIRLMIRPKAA